ncbi:putative reverse transcriptase domain-containing protein [Tanacetum coccineum]
MSSSTVTYTTYTTISRLRLSGPEYPPSPEYVPGLEEPEQAPLSLDYDPEEDPADGVDDADDESSDDDDDDMVGMPSNAEAPMEDQPLPDDASPTALSSGYVARLLALPTPPPSPLTLLSSPLPQIPSPPLPVSSPPLPLPSPPTTSPTYVEAPLGYKAAEIQMRADYHASAAAARQSGPTLEADLRRDRVREIAKRRTAITTTTSTTMNDAQLKALIARGVADALTERDTDRSRNGDDNRFLELGRMDGGCLMFVKFATCTLKGNALTWWNSHVRTVGHDVAYAMPWKTLKNMTDDKYCPRGEIKKLETEMWNLKVKDTNVLSYNQRFQDLAVICDMMFPDESDEVETYFGSLPDMIHESVKASKPKIMQEAIEFATELMDKKDITLGLAGRTKHTDILKSLAQCNYHHVGVTPKCTNFKRIGHSASVTVKASMCCQQKQKSPRGKSKSFTCFECGAQGHFRSNCPKLRNINQGYRAGNGNVVARAYVVGTVGTNPNSNVVTGMFLLNNCYASILFDTGADRSFVSTAFSSLIDIIQLSIGPMVMMSSRLV